ncbi:hypothetical protein GOP47_0028635 [Adiantum capillus-veneris]|nr:hypothetical protein GOP47_0028635 [Adiantum capillus-veneris]
MSIILIFSECKAGFCLSRFCGRAGGLAVLSTSRVQCTLVLDAQYFGHQDHEVYVGAYLSFSLWKVLEGYMPLEPRGVSGYAGLTLFLKLDEDFGCE